MKDSYGEILARCAGPESYAGAGNSVGVATAGVRLGPEIESRNVHRRVCRPSRAKGRLHPVARHGESDRGHGGIYGPGMGGNSKRENREIPAVPQVAVVGPRGRSANLSEGTADTDADGKSDGFVVPTKRTNKAATAVAESVEGRRPPKGSDGGHVCISDTAPKRVYLNTSSSTTCSDAMHRDRLT